MSRFVCCRGSLAIGVCVVPIDRPVDGTGVSSVRHGVRPHA